MELFIKGEDLFLHRIEHAVRPCFIEDGEHLRVFIPGVNLRLGDIEPPAMELELPFGDSFRDEWILAKVFEL